MLGGGITLEVAEVAEDDVLDLNAGGVVGEDQGHSVPSGLTGGWGEGRGTGNMGDTLEGRVNSGGGEAPFFEKGSHLLCSGMKCLILRADAAETEELREGDRVLAGSWVRRGIVQVAVGVGGFVINIGG